ncbi:MAG: DUF1761 domain-containing protein [Gemmatimonadales bacterium]
MRLLAVVVAAVVSFLVGALWYSPLLFGNAYLALRGIESATTTAATPPPSELIAEFIRCLIVAYTFAHFIRRLGIDSVKSALELAFLVWIGFQGFVLIGSVIHEGYPVNLFAIHAGDALVKAITSCVILALWHKRAPLVEQRA